jgi:hypothetical protein
MHHNVIDSNVSHIDCKNGFKTELISVKLGMGRG